MSLIMSGVVNVIISLTIGMLIQVFGSDNHLVRDAVVALFAVFAFFYFYSWT